MVGPWHPPGEFTKGRATDQQTITPLGKVALVKRRVSKRATPSVLHALGNPGTSKITLH